MTFCGALCFGIFTIQKKNLALIERFAEWNRSIKQSLSTRARLAERLVRIRSLTPARSPRSANCSVTCQQRGCAVMTRGGSVSMSKVAAAKLATELAKKATGRTVYILDEPTTGLHFADIEKLLQVLMKLRNAGNTLIVIEHNLEMIKCADWIIDLGPEGGEQGGEIIGAGPPEEIIGLPASYTGRYLRPLLEKG